MWGSTSVAAQALTACAGPQQHLRLPGSQHCAGHTCQPLSYPPRPLCLSFGTGPVSDLKVFVGDHCRLVRDFNQAFSV